MNKFDRLVPGVSILHRLQSSWYRSLGGHLYCVEGGWLLGHLFETKQRIKERDSEGPWRSEGWRSALMDWAPTRHSERIAYCIYSYVVYEGHRTNQFSFNTAVDFIASTKPEQIEYWTRLFKRKTRMILKNPKILLKAKRVSWQVRRMVRNVLRLSDTWTKEVNGRQLDNSRYVELRIRTMSCRTFCLIKALRRDEGLR